MKNQMIRSWLTVVLIIISFVATANAQQSITPEKRALIKELVDITQMQNNSNQMIEAMLAQVEQQSSQLLSQSMKDDKEVTDQEREAMQQSLKENAGRMRKLLTQRVNFSQILEEVMYPLYDKYFTADDLKGVIAFYKSPAGQKFIGATPQLSIELMTKMNEILAPKLQELIRDMREEEKKLKTGAENKAPY